MVCFLFPNKKNPFMIKLHSDMQAKSSQLVFPNTFCSIIEKLSITLASKQSNLKKKGPL